MISKRKIFVMFIDFTFPRYINNFQMFEYDFNKNSEKLKTFKDTVPYHLQKYIKIFSYNFKEDDDINELQFEDIISHKKNNNIDIVNELEKTII